MRLTAWMLTVLIALILVGVRRLEPGIMNPGPARSIPSVRIPSITSLTIFIHIHRVHARWRGRQTPSTISLTTDMTKVHQPFHLIRIVFCSGLSIPKRRKRTRLPHSISSWVSSF